MYFDQRYIDDFDRVVASSPGLPSAIQGCTCKERIGEYGDEANRMYLKLMGLTQNNLLTFLFLTEISSQNV